MLVVALAIAAGHPSQNATGIGIAALLVLLTLKQVPLRSGAPQAKPQPRLPTGESHATT
jgi:hypothetical protein